MNRAELERLDRDALIGMAEDAGVTRARILTRPELVDELLLRTLPDPAARRRARGFFGVARDLVARVIERGLNLPDAADRLRTLGGPPPSSRRAAPAALPTLTLAEIYASQGHRDRALETLEGVISREPDHAAARTLLAQLRDSAYPVPPPRMPPEEDEPPPVAAPSSPLADSAPPPAPPAEPMHMLDDAPLPPRYDVDECVAIPVDPRTLYVYWEARASTVAALAAAHPGGSL
ncbi:MAG TPA: tetratricopeptide repeat protein, partial [Polyangiaceae bacterium]